jgi:transaldolase
MSIYLDSAILSEAQAAVANGWLFGITTNPTLLAQSSLPPAETYRQLAELPVREVYFQVPDADQITMHRQISLAEDILGEKLVVKIPPTREGFTFCARITVDHKTCITAIFSPAQALAALAAGADYIAVYVNRATNWMGDGLGLTRACAQVLAGTGTEILAASLKSTEEVVAAFSAGAQHLTLPFDIFQSLAENEHSQRAVQMFNQGGAYLE